ncbi:hypothetical protein [Paenibacillus sp. FSL E2-0178]|uniref:hypothetical protein n=1 Tax=Paenibacillus sp. FSL E2-0178 TaxID=2921361 RepID=UPI003157FDE7
MYILERGKGNAPPLHSRRSFGSQAAGRAVKQGWGEQGQAGLRGQGLAAAGGTA